MAYGETEGYLMIDDPDGRYLGAQSGLNFAEDYVQTKVRFTFIQDNYSVSKAAQYSSSAILGRSEPIRGYAGSGPRVISLTLNVPPEPQVKLNFQSTRHNDQSGIWYDQRSGVYYGPGLDVPGYSVNPQVLVGASSEGARSSRDEARNNAAAQLMMQKWAIIDFLQSLVYPYYDEKSVVILPPPPVLVMLGTWMSLRGIVTNINFVHKAPFDVSTMTPFYTTVNLTIEEADQPYSFQDVISGRQRKYGYRSDRGGGSQFESYIGAGIPSAQNNMVKGTTEDGREVQTDTATALEALPFRRDPFNLPKDPLKSPAHTFDQFKPKVMSTAPRKKPVWELF